MGFVGLPSPYNLPRGSRVSKAFAEAIRRLELNPDRVREASQHYRGIKGFVEAALPGVHVSLVGSFQRKTKIRPVSSHRLPNQLSGEDVTPIDLDILVSFGPATFWADEGTQPPDLLNLLYLGVRSAARYNVLEPTIDSPTISMSYANEFNMELIPCKIDQISSLPPRASRPYIVPQSDGWGWADYDYDAEVISACNQRSEGLLVPSIKLCKGFVRNNNLPFKSFHVEILCIIVMDRLAKRGVFRWGYQQFLVEFLDVLPIAAFKPASIAGSYSGAQELALFDAIEYFPHLRRIAETANALLAQPDNERTVALWSEFYGYPFPPSTLWLT